MSGLIATGLAAMVAFALSLFGLAYACDGNGAADMLAFCVGGGLLLTVFMMLVLAFFGVVVL